MGIIGLPQRISLTVATVQNAHFNVCILHTLIYAFCTTVATLELQE